VSALRLKLFIAGEVHVETDDVLERASNQTPRR
jgi:hypothetical protein